MATLAESRPSVSQSPWRWAAGFLAQELKPYPGRGWTVSRMVIAATLMMLWIMVFRVPGAALGAYYTLLFSRDSPQATVRSAINAVAAVGCSLCVVLVSAAILAGNPLLHFFWVVGLLFSIFFLISALAEYPVATAFGFLAVNSLTAWGFPANTELLVEGTLWTALAVALAAFITMAVELISQRIRPFDQLKEGLNDRIQIVETLLTAWSKGREIDSRAHRKVVQYAMTGTASLRRLLIRSSNNAEMLSELSATVALAGRLVDLTATLDDLGIALSPGDRQKSKAAAATLQAIRNALTRGDMAAIAALRPNSADAQNSFLSDIERTIALMPQVFSGLGPLSEYLPSPIDLPNRRRFWKDDAFTNPDHVRFALKGTLAATLCYILYNAIDWPGLSTALSTCMITALSTMGSSRQKQVLRVVGALFGAICLGMGAQVFLLPHMEGIGEFTLLFVAVTAISSWIATSSPRLSYAGVQTAFAFYVTHLRTFGPQISLTVARDDVAGILLGLAAMWLTFDQIWTQDSAVTTLRGFTSNLRRIADFDHKVAGRGGLPEAINTARAERGIINNQFDIVRNESDALFFEFGARWRQKVKLRNRIRAWQPQLRTYFLLQISLLHYRLQATRHPLSAEADEAARQSEDLLRMLADWKAQGPAQEPSQALLQLATELNTRISLPEAQSHQGSNSTGICFSMLKVAVGLANSMLTDNSEP